MVPSDSHCLLCYSIWAGRRPNDTRWAQEYAKGDVKANVSYKHHMTMALSYLEKTCKPLAHDCGVHHLCKRGQHKQDSTQLLQVLVLALAEQVRHHPRMLVSHVAQHDGECQGFQQQ